MQNMLRFLVYGLSCEWGGVESIVMSMIHNMAGESCSFDIIHPECVSSYEEKYKNKYIRFVHIPGWGYNRKGFATALKSLFQANNYNYVWVNGCLTANKTIISSTKKYSNARIITHSHGSSFEEKNIFKRIILYSMHIMNRRYYNMYVDIPCMCSKMSGKWFYGSNYVHNHPVYLINNGIVIDDFKFNSFIRDNYRDKFGLSDDFAVFHAGRLTKVKNQQKILSVFADFLKTGIKARLFIAGEGELRDDLENLAKKLSINEKVHFLGRRNDINYLYQAMDVMMLPSLHEGFPVTLTEAQASGLPCLVSDRVSDETNITGLIKFISIDRDDNREWTEELYKIATDKSLNRIEYSDVLLRKGYDLKNICEDFLNYVVKCE